MSVALGNRLDRALERGQNLKVETFHKVESQTYPGFFYEVRQVSPTEWQCTCTFGIHNDPIHISAPCKHVAVAALR